jgi:hypothetical protein
MITLADLIDADTLQICTNFIRPDLLLSPAARQFCPACQCAMRSLFSEMNVHGISRGAAKKPGRAPSASKRPACFTRT